MKQTYYRTLCFLQGGEEEYEECARKFQGRDPEWRCGGHYVAAIKYLRSEFESDEWNDEDITTREPRCSPNDSCYSYGKYTLRYDSTLGGVFLLYRECNKRELEYIEDK